MNETLQRVWCLLTPGEQRRSVFILIAIILMAFCEMIGVISIMPFLTVLAKPEAIDATPWLQRLHAATGNAAPRQFTILLGLCSIALVVGSALFKTVTLHVVNRFVHFLRHSLSERVFARYLAQPYVFHLQRNPSELAKNVLSEVDQLVFDLLQPLSVLVAQGVIVIMITALIVAYDVRFAILMVALLATLYGLIYLVVRRRLQYIGHARHVANTERHKACNEALGGIKDLKVTGSAPAWHAMFSRSSREYSRHAATGETLSTSPLYLVEAAGYSGLILISLLLLTQGKDVAHVLPAIGMYGFAAYRLLPAAQVMYRGFARLRFSAASLNHIIADLRLPLTEIVRPATAMNPQRDIELKNVHYRYVTGGDKPALDGIDLTIPINTSVGIAGKSGAGKSTLMDVLLGLLKPDTGAMFVDGAQVDLDNPSAWQQAVGYVPQHIYLADASVAENIAFGVPKADINMTAVKRAASAAQIDDFVMGNLNQGYESVVGDRGIRLSGGQRQRVGIARALYRDPPVLLFDEATSALDGETEDAVNAAIRGLSGSKTIIVIAHRQASLETCDRIVTLRDGKIVGEQTRQVVADQHTGNTHT